MTLQALNHSIAHLMQLREQAHGNDCEQARINAKLTKLYTLKQTMLEQGGAVCRPNNK